MPDSFLRKKSVIVSIVVLIIAFMVVFLYMTSEGSHQDTDASKGSIPLGNLGAICGGPDLLPCNPGLVCSTPVEQLKEKTGTCIADTRSPAQTVKEGEACDRLNTVCEPGFACQDVNGNKQCVSIVSDQKSFIVSVVPEGMSLEGGVYKAAVGTEVRVVVKALNVEGGNAYLLPLTSSKSDANDDEKIGSLAPVQGEENTYDVHFTVKSNTLANLIVKMKGKDGQEQRLQVTVGYK